MKKFIFLILSCFAMIALNAQVEHMAFKGIPIDGSLSDFTLKMKQKGYVHQGTQDGIALFSGEFAAFKNCVIGVVSSKSTGVVNKVAVAFPENETWAQLYGTYNRLKEMLTQKYGNPVEVVERFDGYSEPNDDNSRMHEVKMDRCKYETSWTTSKGDIEIRISHEGFSSCFVVLSYWDEINTEKVKNSAIDDL